MLTFQQLIPIFIAPIGGGYLLSLHRRYEAWKETRTDAPYYRNWRGQYVQDLWVKRGERLFWLSVIAFFVVGFVLSYSWLTID